MIGKLGLAGLDPVKQQPPRIAQASNAVVLLQVMAISQLIAKDFGNARDLSGIGGVETGADAAEFLLLGANSVQVLLAVH